MRSFKTQRVQGARVHCGIFDGFGEREELMYSVCVVIKSPTVLLVDV